MSRQITDAERERVKANFLAGMRPIANAIDVGCSRSTVDKILEDAGLHIPDRLGAYGVTITNNVEDYREGDQFTIERVRTEVDFGNMPNGLTMDFANGWNAEMRGARLYRSDGKWMRTRGAASHRWV